MNDKEIARFLVHDTAGVINIVARYFVRGSEEVRIHLDWIVYIYNYIYNFLLRLEPHLSEFLFLFYKYRNVQALYHCDRMFAR